MKSEIVNGIELWRFENLSSVKEVGHYVSARNSQRAEGELTLSLSSSPDKAYVRRNREELATALGIEKTRMFFPSQIHETRIVQVTSKTKHDELLGTDALVTAERGLCISVMSADCVPILIYDQRNQVVAAVHAGWRGTVARIVEKTLDHLKEAFGTKGPDIIAGIGPSASPEVYEVGDEVAEMVSGAFGAASARLLLPSSNGKAKLDLWSSNAIQLQEFGVERNNIEVSNLCTILNNEHFFSARKGDAGRFAAGIYLR